MKSGQFPLFSSTKSRFLCALALRNPHFRAFRAQNRHFCALLAFGTLVFGLFEHKIEVFVRFWPSGPPFSGISSTKSRFLCAFALRDPRFRASRAQNRGFCALLPSEPPIFGSFEHKIEVFVRFWLPKLSFSGLPSTKLPFLCSFTKLDVGLGHFPADSGIVAPAEPSHLHSRRICVAAVPSAVACSRLPPVLPLLPPLHLRSRFTCSPLHLLSRCTCATAVPAAVARRCTCAADTTAAYPRCT